MCHCHGCFTIPQMKHAVVGMHCTIVLYQTTVEPVNLEISVFMYTLICKLIKHDIKKSQNMTHTNTQKTL